MSVIRALLFRSAVGGFKRRRRGGKLRAVVTDIHVRWCTTPTHLSRPSSLPRLLFPQACESPHSSSSSFRTPQHRRQNSDAHTLDSVSWTPPSSVSIPETMSGAVVAYLQGSFTASCHMLAFSINLCLLLKGGKAQIIGPEEEYEDDFSYAFHDVSGDGSLSSAPHRGFPRSLLIHHFLLPSPRWTVCSKTSSC